MALEPLRNIKIYCTNWAQSDFLWPALSCHIRAAAPPPKHTDTHTKKSLPLVSHPPCLRWKVSKSSEASCVVMLGGNVMLPSRTTRSHTHPHTVIHNSHSLTCLTGWSVGLGELIVFRWGNLRRSSGREDRSKERQEKRREARGCKLPMRRIFGFHMGFDEQAADTFFSL